MIRIQDTSVKTKIYGTVAIFQILALFIAILGVIGLVRLERELEEVYDLYNSSFQKLGRFVSTIDKTRNHATKTINSTDIYVFQESSRVARTSLREAKQLVGEFAKYVDEDKSIQSQCTDCIQKTQDLLDLLDQKEKMFDTSFGLTERGILTKNDTLIKQANEIFGSFNDKHFQIVHQAQSLMERISLISNQKKILIQKTSFEVKVILFGGLAVSAIIVAILSYFLVRKIATPIRKVELMANRFAEGDLTVIEERPSKDEIGRVFDALNRASENLRFLVGEIGRTSDHLASSAEQLNVTSNGLADGASNQAASLEETASAITQITESIFNVARSASEQALEAGNTIRYMSELSQSIAEITKIAKTVNEGSQAVLTEAEEGQNKVSETTKRMGAIEESSEMIADIINVINDISDQTNLLALNAAIEAARAGESGRGFAVVAEEISKLASRSQEATKEIEELIQDSLQKVNDGKSIVIQVVESLDRIVQRSRQAAHLTEQISQATNIQNKGSEKVLGSITTLTSMSTFISNATKEQEISSKEMANAIEQVNSIAQSNAASSEEMAASTNELAKQSEKMNELISNFKLK
jgi:methyl-accepting chemotaxis protein